MNKSRSQYEIVSQETYRDIDRLSYSSLKMYEENRKRFKSIYIDKDQEVIEKYKEDQAKNDYIRMGNIVDVMLTDNDNFYNYFIESTSIKPTGQLLIFVDALLKITKDESNDGVASTSFQDRCERAYDILKEWNGGKLRDGFDTVVNKFEKEGKGFYEESLKSIGKTVITPEEASLATSILNNLKTSFNTKNIVNSEGLTKYPILFDLMDIPFKMEADKIIFDHENKIIKPYDYKITSFIENFIWDGFLKKRYYLQSCLYKWGIEQWKDSNEYKSYRVDNLCFVVADQTNYFAPLLYETADKHYEQGWEGFKIGNKHYKGIVQIIEDIKFSKERDKWDMSASNIRNNGKILIPLFEDSN